MKSIGVCGLYFDLLILQTPIEDLPNFQSSNTHHAPILHLVLKESEGRSPDKLLQFLCQIPCLDELATKVCAHGFKAGKCCPDQAVRILCAAAQSDRYLNIVKSLLDADTDVNGIQDEKTPLMHAAANGNMDILRTLLTYKASVDFVDNQQENSLFLACRSRQWEAAKLLFESEANALYPNVNGQTALDVAFTNGGVDFVKYMASRRPAVLHKMKQKISTLSDACHFSCDMLVELYPNLSNEQINEVATQACLLRNTDVLQFTGERLDNDALITHITHAYQADHFECLDVLLNCAEGRKELTYPEISLTESCKHKELINLTMFLATEENINEDNGEPIRTAAKSGNLSAVEYLIELCDVDIPDTQGATALLFACMESHFDIIDKLLEWDVDVNICAEETPLTAACRNGRQEIVNCLLKKTPNLSKPNKLGMTPVEVAVNHGHTALAANLLKKGAAYSFQKVPFHSLCQLVDTEEISAFLQTCTNHQIADEKLLSVVVKADNSKLLDLLLSNGKVRENKNALEQALETACIMGSKMIVRTLIEWDNGSIWKSNKEKPEKNIYQAIKGHHPDIVKMLLDKGCYSTTDTFPLEDIVRSNRILTLMVDYMPQSLLNQALIVACSSGHRIPESCVRILLNKSADTKYHDPKTQLTPLLAATITPSETLVRILLEYGADPNVTDEKNNSPLYLACDIQSHSIASQLIYNKDDENEGCKYKRVSTDLNPSNLPPEKYPLWISCLQGYLDLVALLAENKANLNLRNERESLLEASHKAGQHEVVRLLLEYGADPANLSSIDLKTACQYGYAERAAIISHEATVDELSDYISEACNEGFPETGMGIVISIPEEDKQKELCQVLEQRTDPSPQPQSTNDTRESQSQETNPLWQCFYNRNTEQMLKLIKAGWSPNITNTHGITLLQVCVSDKRIPTVHELCALRDINQKSVIDINQKDSSSRNVLFYVLKYLRGLPEQADLFYMLIERGADMKVTDNFGRTLLHEWNPQPAPQTRAATACKDDISLESFMKHIRLDECDFKGQTSLHAAVLQNNPMKVQQLLEAGISPIIPDSNEISALKLAARNQDMYQVFISFDQNLGTIESLIPASDDVQRASFSNEYTAAHRIPAALNKLFHKTNLQSSLHLFRENLNKNASFKNESKKFCEIVPQFMKDLSDEIAKEDPLFAFEPTLSGSCSEGTNLVAMDDAKVLCLFNHPDWKKLDVSNHEEGNYTFMKLSSAKFAEMYPKLVRKSCLSVHGVFEQFYGLIRKSLAEVLLKYKNLYIREPNSILESTYAISDLKLSWSDEIIQWQEFSLEVVPAIPLTEDKIPKELNHYELLHDIFVVPEWTASLIETPYVDEAFQLGFSFPENDLLRAMPIELRQGYMLTKVVMQDCMIIDSRPIDLYISSYLLKYQMFECFAQMPEFAKKMKARAKRDLTKDKLQASSKLLKCADKILEKLEEGIKNHHQESFFLKGCNLLSHSNYREDFRPLLYTRLCRAMLQSPSDNIDPWKTLAQMVAEQLVKEEHFQSASFIEEVSTLKTMGLDVNWRSKNGTCLLYYMIKYGLVHGVHMLVKWGATSEDVDGNGRSAFQVAEDFKQPAIQKLLQEEGKCVRGKCIILVQV